MYGVRRILLSPIGCWTSLIGRHGSSMDIPGLDELVKHFKCSSSRDLESNSACCLKNNPKTWITQHLTIVVH
ncbi:hypothetical protein GQ457_03G011360 [Hibiscus cannabinus]